MVEMITFGSNGGTGQGYLATPEGGAGPGVVVIQEWWGLVPHIQDVCDRMAAAGFTALAPDLYHGEKTTEPDDATKLMLALRLDGAVKDMGGAAEALRERSTGDRVGVVGFCMGGGLALILAARRPDVIGACSAFYGAIPWPDAEPDWGGLSGPLQMHVGDKDAWAMNFMEDLDGKLGALGKEREVFVYPGCDHAFFNDARPEVYDADASALAWERSLAMFRRGLG